MKISMPTRQEGLSCACLEPLTAQFRRRFAETQTCIAPPFVQDQKHKPPPAAGSGEHPLAAGAAPPDRHPDARALLRKLCVQFPHARYAAGRALFRQGDPADAIFYVGSGRLHRTITSENGEDRLVAILGPRDFCGEESLTRCLRRATSAVVVEDAEVVRIDRSLMPRLLSDWPDLASAFTSYLISHCLQTESALIDQLFGSVEQRLRRVLLRLANVGEGESRSGTILNVRQMMLADMVGTTRPRVNYLLNKFRKLGLIDYGGAFKDGEILVHAGLGRMGEQQSGTS